jgi:5-methyltetrahydropteroyltriglutamate--homocysteine methyltransferase
LTIERSDPERGTINICVQSAGKTTYLLNSFETGDRILDVADRIVNMVDGRVISDVVVSVAPERLIVAPDCGLKYLPREVAFGKLQAMVAGAAIVRRELRG